MPCKSCAGGRRLRCAGPHLRAVRRRFWPRVRSAPGGRGSCAGRCFCRTPRRLRPSPGQRMPPGPPTSPRSRTAAPRPCPRRRPPRPRQLRQRPRRSRPPASTPLPSAAPELDDAGRIRSVTLRQGSGDGYVALAAGSIRNSTEHTDADLRAAVTTQNLPFAVEKNSALPQVLIMHTHATESYQTWPDPVFDPGYTARSKKHGAEYVCRRRENGAGAQRGGHPHAARRNAL